MLTDSKVSSLDKVDVLMCMLMDANGMMDSWTHQSIRKHQIKFKQREKQAKHWGATEPEIRKLRLGRISLRGCILREQTAYSATVMMCSNRASKFHYAPLGRTYLGPAQTHRGLGSQAFCSLTAPKSSATSPATSENLRLVIITIHKEPWKDLALVSEDNSLVWSLLWAISDTLPQSHRIRLIISKKMELRK